MEIYMQDDKCFYQGRKTVTSVLKENVQLSQNRKGDAKR